jgi:Ran GTPase-activating protein (RanGAP) involved in mRNA processing and transport
MGDLSVHSLLTPLLLTHLCLFRQLNLSNNRVCGVWVEYGTQKGEEYNVEGINAIADALRVNGGLTKLLLAKNKLGEEGTKFLCDALVGNNTLKELDLSGDTSLGDTVSNIGGTAGAKHVANMLLVNGALTSVDLSSNNLTDYGRDMTGIKKLAAALGVNGSLTCVDFRNNSIAGDGAVQLSAAVLGNLKIDMFNDIPIKEMRADSFTELDLKGKGVGVEGGMVVAGLIPVMGALKSIDLSGNQLCGIWTDGYGNQEGTYTAEGITAIADALRVNGALTQVLVFRSP